MNQKPVDDTPQIDDHEHVYICQDCGEIGTSIKPVDDEVDGLTKIIWQWVDESQLADTFDIPALKALLNAHYQKKYLGLLEELSSAVIEPCEPDCDEIRHARHEGTWKAHLIIDEAIANMDNEDN